MICAIDPGYTGDIAFLTEDGILIDVVDMPVIKHAGKTRIVATDLAVILDSRSMDIAYLIIERVGARPGQGVTSMFNFGYGAGLVEGIAAALFVPYFHVLPQTWKRQRGVGADKGACRALAQKLWPGAADKFKRKKDDGRADAALLGRWACLNGLPSDS